MNLIIFGLLAVNELLAKVDLVVHFKCTWLA